MIVKILIIVMLLDDTIFYAYCISLLLEPYKGSLHHGEYPPQWPMTFEWCIW